MKKESQKKEAVKQDHVKRAQEVIDQLTQQQKVKFRVRTGIKAGPAELT